jgi:hypothetical protein
MESMGGGAQFAALFAIQYGNLSSFNHGPIVTR